MLQVNIEKDIYFQKIRSIFGDMANGYDKVATQFGFDCKGCTDSCCLTLFYHHTFIEYLYLKHGLSTLDSEILKKVQIKAESQIDALKKHDSQKTFRKMCPLNVDGLCILYEYRPMICRLHGVYHELRKPGGSPVKGPGCEIFMDLSSSKEYFPLDRTPYYIQLASLEKQLREETGMNQRIKMTIAEIILD